MEEQAIGGKFLLDKKSLTAYFMLPKPGIVLLSLVAGWTGVFIGSHGAPNPHVALWLTLGLGLATAGAATLNNFFDRDIDQIMGRTQNRSLPSGVVSPRFASGFGISCIVASLFITQFYLGTLTSLLTGAAIFIYVVLYTLHLKRTTPMATHIGGISGAMPPLIGYVAAHGSIDMNGLILFLIIVVWQQPHFWALALKYREDYAAANVPVHPVSLGVKGTKIRLMVWTVALLPVALLPYFVDMAGKAYLAVTVILTLVYIVITAKFIMSDKDKEMSLFFYSVFYLGVVFGVLVFDITGK